MSGSCEKYSGMFAVSNEQRLLGRAGISLLGLVCCDCACCGTLPRSAVAAFNATAVVTVV